MKGHSFENSEYLNGIRTLVSAIDSIKQYESAFRSFAVGKEQSIPHLFKGSLPAGFFYEQPLLEHFTLFIHLGDLGKILAEEIKRHGILNVNPEEINAGPPEWFNTKDGAERSSNFFAGLWTFLKSTQAIETTGQSINGLIAGGRNGDRSAFVQAVRLDALAITCPSIANEMLKSEVFEGGQFKNELLKALRSPKNMEGVEHGTLRYVLRIMHDDNKLHLLSEDDRYEFFCRELKLYPDRNFEAKDSLNRFIRDVVSKFGASLYKTAPATNQVL